MTEITYQPQREDMVAFFNDYASVSPTARRNINQMALRMFVTTVATSGAIWLLSRNIVLSLLVLIIGLTVAAFMPWRVRRAQRKLASSLYREGVNRALFIPMTLGIDRDCLTWKSEAGAGYMKFEYLERVRQTATHLFIYLNVRHAYIIPRERIISGDFDSFAWEVEKRWRTAMDSLSHQHEMASV
jgi:hypothetical protein